MRGAGLLGSDSDEAVLEEETVVWVWIAVHNRSDKLAYLVQDIPLEQTTQALEDLLAGKIQGRFLVKIAARARILDRVFIVVMEHHSG